jgi:uncharacterized protein YhaN
MKIISIILAVLLVAAAAVLVLQQQAQVKLRQENDSLRQQLAQLAALQADNEQLSNRLAQANATADARTTELLKLRNEAGTLHKQTGDIASLQSKIADLQNKNQQLIVALASSRNALLAKTPTETAPKTNAPDNATADAANGPDLGVVQLVNQMSSQFDLGSGKVCTPTIKADGTYDIKVVFESQKPDGQTEQSMGQVTTSPGRAVRITVGDSSIGFTPTVNPAQ